MRNSGICPKCKSTEMIKIPGKIAGHNWLPVGFGSVAVERWICGSCGYTEEWISEEDLQKVKDFWGIDGKGS